MHNLENTFCVRPLSVVVVPGVSVTINLPTQLNTEVGSTYTIGPISIPAPYTGREEVIVNIDKAYAGVDNWGKYIVSQMLHNRGKRCLIDGSKFRIQLRASGTEVVVAFLRGLDCRRAFLATVTPPTP